MNMTIRSYALVRAITGLPAFELINVLPLNRMKQALEDPRYRWRSVERLSHIAGVPEADALKILRDDAAIVLGMGKSGREIARLKSS